MITTISTITVSNLSPFRSPVSLHHSKPPFFSYPSFNPLPKSLLFATTHSQRNFPIPKNPLHLFGGLARSNRPKARRFTTWAVLAGFESFQSVIQATSVLAAIIIVHESGHFLAATLQGIRVSKFAVGFGPVLAKFNSNNVEYSFGLFLWVGSLGSRMTTPIAISRVIVISAGVIANIVFAYLIIFTQVVSVGLPVQETLQGVRIPEVIPNSAAQRYGIESGDVILGINDVDSPSVSDVVEIIKKNAAKNIDVKVKRYSSDDRALVINMIPDRSSDGTGRIGVQLTRNYKVSKAKPLNLREALSFSGREFWGLSSTVLDGLRQTFQNLSQSANKVSGPVAIIAVGAEVARSNTDGLYQFAAILNINLAVINLLPLPALDGGSLAFVLVEAIRGGRKIPKELEQRIQSSGIMVVLVLGVFLIVRDTLNLNFIKELL
ncbi:Membrane-associated zinc metalloprotease family protein, expressed [Zostera marina]|uniref:Membrane-associated zinc metalloprotease family protein, expressed n=1 Tax=Zostera marina TaxID=29655 RepID=A0A0K9PR18_ZOSMR|nr:Membrane-associated zinc metalloprotease family protein, expressed [Zostera marina]